MIARPLQQVVSISAVLFLIFAPLCLLKGQTSVWTGAGGDGVWSNAANWQNGTVPPSGADVTLNAPSYSQSSINLYTSPSINSLSLGGTSMASYWIYGRSAGATLTIGSGGLAVGSSSMYDSFLFVDSSASLGLSAAQSWTIGSSAVSGMGFGSATFNGNITGASDNPLDIEVSQSGWLTLGGNNSFSGTVTLNSGTLNLDSSTALGNATLVLNGSPWISSDSCSNLVVPNAVTINGGTTSLEVYYGSLAFSGPVTLSGPSEVDVYGPAPVIFSGTLQESGGSQSLTKGGTGMLVITGSGSPTGGMAVNDGLMILASGAALPVGGHGAVGVYGNGYLGIDLAATGISATTFIDRLDRLSSGTIGFDTADLTTPAVVNDTVDLSSFSNDTSAYPRLGSATSAIINGTIIPGSGDYQFGGGGGTLQVTSNLTDGDGFSRGLTLYSPSGENQSLLLILSGTNTYSLGTTINDSLLRFSSAAALPASGDFTFTNRGYLGLDYTPAGLDLQNLWPRIIAEGATAVLGFDSPDAAAPNSVSISTDLLADYFPSGAYLGTSTSATIGIYKGDSSMPANLGFAAVRGGHLTVSPLPAGDYSLTLGLPNDNSETLATSYTYDSADRGAFATSQSTVEMQGPNTYTLGTTLQGGTVVLDDPAALGTGTITVSGNVTLSTSSSSTSGSTSGSIAAAARPVAAMTSGFTVANPITFTEDATPTLTLDATNSFTLSGSISGSSGIVVDKIGAGILTLSGDNSAFSGEVCVNEGELDVANDAAVASADLWVSASDSSPVVSFLTSSPQVASLNGNGAVNLNSAALTITGSNGNTSDFSGPISGTGSIAVSSSTGSVNVFLFGDNSYSGGTTVSGNADHPAVLIAGSNTALGTGTVSVSGGSLFVFSNATLTNPLTFSTGTIGGAGTFAPPGGVVIGSSRVVSPGLSSSYADTGNSAIGELGFGTGLTFGPGGTYQWELANASGVAGTGWDAISVTGALSITSTSADPFTIAAANVGSSYSGTISFNNTQYYSWTIASASGGITGFDAGAIAVDSSGLTNLGIGHLFLSEDGNDLVLNFDPVPEPSTYALMGLGLGLVVLGLRRRQRNAC